MKSLGPAWWGGLLLGLFLGIFAAGLLVESELPASAWKWIRGGSMVAACLTSIIGSWGLRRSRADQAL